MRGAHAAPALRDVDRLFRAGSVAGLSDEELLARFLASRDPSAFEAIVSRHGPSVLAHCRAILGDDPSADDAFQAVFLVLVRKAPSIRVDGSLGRWLRGVSRRVAVRAAKGRAMRSRRESEIGADPASEGPDDAERREVAALLHAEIAGLPASYRDPIVAHYFEGLSHEGVAARLRWPIGTVKGRLARARRLLRDRLARRGIGIGSAALISTLARKSSASVVRPALREATVQAAIGPATGGRALAAGVAATTALSLSKGVTRAMFLSKLSVGLAATMLSTALMATGLHVASGRPARDEGGPGRDGLAGPIMAPSSHRSDSAKVGTGEVREPMSEQVSEPDALMRAIARDVEAGMSAKDREAAIQARERVREAIHRLEERQQAAKSRVVAAQGEVTAIQGDLDQAREAHERLYRRILEWNADRGAAPRSAARDGAETHTVVYRVGDLVEGPPGIKGEVAPDYAPLIDLITTSVAPGTWRLAEEQDTRVGPERGPEEQGRIGTITPFFLDSSLIVRHNRQAHQGVVERLRQLRRLRGLSDPPRQTTAGQRFDSRFAPPQDTFSPQLGERLAGFDYILESPDELIVKHDRGGRPGSTASGTYRINEKGVISLGGGHLGDVHVAGLGLREAKAKIVEHLRQAFSDEELGLVEKQGETMRRVEPADSKRVEVSVRPMSRYVHVRGAVARPGKQEIGPSETALDTLQRAGGLKGEPGPIRVLVIRVSPENGRVESVRRVDLRAIMEQGQTETNVALRPGDILDVRPMPPAARAPMPVDPDADRPPAPQTPAPSAPGAEDRSKPRPPTPATPVPSAPVDRGLDELVRQIAYDVGDLIPHGRGGAARPAEGFTQAEMKWIADVVRSAVTPDLWTTEPGRKAANGRPLGSIRWSASDGKLIIRQTVEIHQKIRDLLDTLRRIRRDEGEAPRR